MWLDSGFVTKMSDEAERGKEFNMDWFDTFHDCKVVQKHYNERTRTFGSCYYHLIDDALSVRTVSDLRFLQDDEVLYAGSLIKPLIPRRKFYAAVAHLRYLGGSEQRVSVDSRKRMLELNVLCAKRSKRKRSDKGGKGAAGNGNDTEPFTDEEDNGDSVWPFKLVEGCPTAV